MLSAIKKAVKTVKKVLKVGTFLAFQAQIILDNRPVIVVEKSRRVGFTWSLAYRAVRRAALGVVPNAPKSWFSSADDSAAVEYISYCAEWAQKLQVKAVELGEVLYDSEQDITSRALRLANGREIHALTSNSRQFRSKGGDGYWDEAAHHDNPIAMYKAFNALKLWGGSLVIGSTHNGPNSMFNRLVKKAQGSDRWGHYKVTIHDAIRQGMLDKILGRKATKAEVLAFLEELREDALDEDTWQQEFCCVPLDEGNALLSYDLIYPCEREGLLCSTVEQLRALKGNLYLGWDVARKKHLSVMWIFEEVAGLLITRQIVVFQNTPFHIQKQALYSLLDLPNMRRAAIDQTGMGLPLTEAAQLAYGDYLVEGVTMTNPIKEKLAMGLRAEFDDKTLLIPGIFEVREDLHSVRKVMTAGGNVRLEGDDSIITDQVALNTDIARHPNVMAEVAQQAADKKDAVRFDVRGGQKGGHADRFWAAALARAAARSPDTSPAFMASSERRQSSIHNRSLEKAFTDITFRGGGYDGY